MNQNSSRIVNGDLVSRKPYPIAIKQQPITVEHKPYVPETGDHLSDFGTARATLAVSNESPNGTTQDGYAAQHQHQTVRWLWQSVHCKLVNLSAGGSTARSLLGSRP